MDNPNCNTEHRKGQHITAEERHEIEVRSKDGWKIYRIAKHLGRPYNTIKNEVLRGTVSLYNGKVQRYKAKTGEETYRKNRLNCRRKYHLMEVQPFLRFVEKEVLSEKKWSLDACVGHAKQSGNFSRGQMVCTKTLYNYVDLGFLTVTNMELPEKLSRNTKRKKVRENQKILGNSIELRPDTVESREEFGHWEIDSVLGKKAKTEEAAMTLVERKTRNSLWIKVRGHSAEAVMEAIGKLETEYGERFSQVFKSITGDNGSEFALLHELEDKGISVYFTHPYSAWEKGSNECHNRMLRRFIPKGKSMAEYSQDALNYFSDVINGLPRKILAYKTPEELFEQELDRIFALA